MRRLIEDKLKAWKHSANRKPLILQGARQVGKTWAIMDFGRTHFDEVAYVNFLDDENLKSVFEGDLDPKRLLDAVALQTGITPKPETTLVVFDEIQECPRALTSLKAFAERSPETPLIAAGSLLGVALHRAASFPVGKVDHLVMYPMSFLEYLLAVDQPLAIALERRDYSLIDAFSQRYVDALKRYYFVGGMPEAVAEFANSGSYANVRAIQKRLLFDYEHDFSKYADAQLAEKIRMIWNSAPAQLGRENKKFLYSAVRTGARARGYEEAIQWLVDAGLLLKVNRISKPGLPLISYEDRDAFKLFLFDVGLLGAACGLDQRVLLNGSSLFTEFKGSLTENYVCQELIASGQIRPFYWSADNSSNEVDFVFEQHGYLVPLEVKAELNLRSKSLKSFIDKYGLKKGVRLSLAGLKDQEWLQNVPLYECGLLAEGAFGDA